MPERLVRVVPAEAKDGAPRRDATMPADQARASKRTGAGRSGLTTGGRLPAIATRPKGIGLRLLRDLYAETRGGSPAGSPQSMPAQSPQGSLLPPAGRRASPSPVARRRLVLEGSPTRAGGTPTASPGRAAANPVPPPRAQSRFAHERRAHEAAAAHAAAAARRGDAAAAVRRASLRKVMSAPDGQLQAPSGATALRSRALSVRKPLPLPPAMLGSPVAGSVVASPQSVRNISFNNRYGAAVGAQPCDTPTPSRYTASQSPTLLPAGGAAGAAGPAPPPLAGEPATAHLPPPLPPPLVLQSELLPQVVPASTAAVAPPLPGIAMQERQLVMHSKFKSCIVRSDVAAFEALLAAGADLNVHVPGEETLLHEAARAGSVSICELLLKHGMDPNARDRLMYTPLHHACQHSHRGAVRVLLEAGASIRARTVSGETPLQLAMSDRVRRLFGQKIGGTSPDTPAQPMRRGFQVVFAEEAGRNDKHGDVDEDEESNVDIPERTETPPLLHPPPKHKFHASRAGQATKSLEPVTPRMGAADAIAASAESDPAPEKGSDAHSSNEMEHGAEPARASSDDAVGPLAYPDAGLHAVAEFEDTIDMSLYPVARGEDKASTSSDVAGEDVTDDDSLDKLAAELAKRMQARAEDASPQADALARTEGMFRQSVRMQTGRMHWARGELIGEGAFGKVYAGLSQETGELMAVKQLNMQSVGEVTDAVAHAVRRKAKSLEREIEMYKALRHKHVVRYIACEVVSDVCYVFLEFVPGGSIASMLKRFGAFSETLTAQYTWQILLGVEYLHSMRVVHRDLKGANILVSRDGGVKLADFGACRQKDRRPGSSDADAVADDDDTPKTARDGIDEDNADDERGATGFMKSIHGSIFWMAPECVRGEGYGRRADIWSVGATSLEMLTGTRPWPNLENHWSAMFAIARATEGPPRPDTLSTPCANFLARCFQFDPRERPRAAELLSDAFVASSEAAMAGASQAVELKHSL